MNKSAVRKKMLHTLQQIPVNEKQNIENSLHRNLFASQLWENADTIGITYSQSFEWDTLNIIKEAWRLGKTTAVPKCDVINHQLYFYDIKEEKQLEIGYANMMEPNIEKTTFISKQYIDLLVVPGIAFDQEGYRIGFGGGYYDRFLADFHGVTVSLVSDRQFISKLPTDDYDLPVQYLVTETDCFPVRK